MKKILYVGNKLSKHGNNKTTIETLGECFEEEGYNLKYTSDKKNRLLRLIDMFCDVLVYGKQMDYLIIDTYSTVNFWYAIICSQIARFLKVKYIPILHGGALPNRLNNNPYLSRLVFDNAYLNVAPSMYLKTIFEEEGYSNTCFIPNILTITQYKYKQRTNVAPKILWVRAFANIYNPKMAIKVFEKVKLKYPQAELCMVGPDKDGSLEETKLLAKELNLDVEFTGKLSKEEWLKKSKNFDVFINTTHFDNTPVSVMEAMALGLPIVSTNVGGLSFLLEDNKDALLVEDNNINQMLGSIELLVSNRDLVKEITNNARKKVEGFDWEKVRKQWDIVFK